MSSHPPTLLPLHLLFPLLSGVVYVVGALLLKRAADLGADMWRTARICNLTTALMFAPLALLGGTVPSWQLCWQPALVALCFIAGQVFTLLALKIGDVSVATPVMGLKILFVAFLTTALIGERIRSVLWTAALLSSIAIGLLNFSRAPSHHRVGATILLAASAATSYALVDVLVQKWSPVWGAGRLLPLMMAFAAAASPALRPLGRWPNIRKEAVLAPVRRWVAGGAVCLGLQAIMIVSSIVLYSSRGLWSVLAVWLVGHWFVNRERYHSHRILAWRLLGATLLMAAILMVL